MTQRPKPVKGGNVAINAAAHARQGRRELRILSYVFPIFGILYALICLWIIPAAENFPAVNAETAHLIYACSALIELASFGLPFLLRKISNTLF